MLAAGDQTLNMSERISTGLSVLLFGMGVVFSVLILIWGILVLFRVIFYDIPNKKNASANKTETAVEPEPEPVPEPEAQIAESETGEANDEEVVAAITAAISLMLDKPQTSFRVVSFRRTASK